MSNTSKMTVQNKNSQGFKETNVGAIPKGWRACRLLDIVTSTQLGGNYNGSLQSSGLPLIKMGNMTREGIVIEKLERIDCEPDERDILRAGDFLFNTRNTMELVGKTCIWRGELGVAVFNSNILRIGFSESVIAGVDFACIAFNANYAIRQLRSLATGTTSVAAIYWRDLKNLILFIPPISEQLPISNILRTCDATIDRTRDLITAKKQQKKALMQQLLTGKKRLPGFSGAWVSRPIRTIFKTVSRPVIWDDDHVYSLLSVRRRSGGVFLREHLKGSKILTKNLFTAHAGDFLISKMQVLHGATGLVPPKLDGCHISGSYIALRPQGKDLIDPVFFTCFSDSPAFRHLTYLCSYGVHIEKMTFNLSWFLDSKIVVPPTGKEQRAIADVLAAADAEITLLEEKHASLQLLKKGLMQKLLTGEIRVKP